MRTIIEQYYREFIIVILVIVIVVLAILFLNKKEENIVETSVDEISYVESNEEEQEEVITKIKVDIKGAVAKPGVYELEANSVVNDAIKLAGGLKKNANTSNINLSKELENEMVIKVFTASEIKKLNKEAVVTNDNICTENTIVIDKCSESPIIKDTNTPDSNSTTNNNSNDNSNTTNSSSKLVSLNTATIDELVTLPGIGESKAENIIKYREENGTFKTTEEIINVSGIGEAAYNKIKDYITI